MYFVLCFFPQPPTSMVGIVNKFWGCCQHYDRQEVDSHTYGGLYAHDRHNIVQVSEQ